MGRIPTTLFHHAMTFALVGLLACDTPPREPEPTPVDDASVWDKSRGPVEEWEAVPCSEAERLEEAGQPEARFHLGLVVSGDCGIDCEGVSVSIPRQDVEPYVRKALRVRDDCRHCEIERLVDFVARGVEADVAAAQPGAPPGWSYRAAMLHPRRPFHPHAELSLEAALMELVREPGQPPRTAALLRRCRDGSLDPSCERLVFGEHARAGYQEDAQRALDESAPPLRGEEP